MAGRLGLIVLVTATSMAGRRGDEAAVSSMTVAAFVILAVCLFFTWTDPDGYAKVPHFGSDGVPARLVVVAASWLFCAGAAWMLSSYRGVGGIPGWFSVLMTGFYFIPALWTAERGETAGEMLVGFWMGPVVVVCASIAGALRLVKEGKRR